MPYIRSQKLHDDDQNVLSLVDGDGGKYSLSRSQYTNWRLVNPTANEKNLEDFLGTAILLPGGTQIHIHIYELESAELVGYPHLAVLTANAGVEVDADWWRLPVPPEPKENS